MKKIERVVNQSGDDFPVLCLMKRSSSKPSASEVSVGGHRLARPSVATRQLLHPVLHRRRSSPSSVAQPGEPTRREDVTSGLADCDVEKHQGVAAVRYS